MNGCAIRVHGRKGVRRTSTVPRRDHGRCVRRAGFIQPRAIPQPPACHRAGDRYSSVRKDRSGSLSPPSARRLRPSALTCGPTFSSLPSRRPPWPCGGVPYRSSVDATAMVGGVHVRPGLQLRLLRQPGWTSGEMQDLSKMVGTHSLSEFGSTLPISLVCLSV